MATDLLDKLLARRSRPGATDGVTMLSAEAYERRSAFAAEQEKIASYGEGQATTYIVATMEPMDPDSTTTILADGAKFRDSLRMCLQREHLPVEFDFQGSVTNQTHVKWKSDLDLLVIDDRFVTLEHPQIPASRYLGTPVDDLKQLRTRSIDAVRKCYPGCLVNSNGPKSVAVSGGDLVAKLDLVICNWWNTNDFTRTNDKRHRGIQILNMETDRRMCNKPFLHNWHIEHKDAPLNGNLRKAVRFLKSIKYDFKVAISSYDIAAICFNMPAELLKFQSGKDLRLAENCVRYLVQIEEDATFREGLAVPNGMRKVFCAEGATSEGLKHLRLEGSTLVNRAREELSATSRQLAEAIIHKNSAAFPIVEDRPRYRTGLPVR